MTRKCYKSFYNSNHIITQMSEITTLKSLNIENIVIDDNTVKCLALFKNLKQLRLTNAMNTIKRDFYSSLCVHLPKLTDLSLYIGEKTNEEIELKWIRDMISSLNYLECFSYSLMNWQLLDMILQVQLPRQQSVMKIGVSNALFNDPRKKEFASISRGAIQLTLNE